jgi:hypothetical protein
MRVEIAVEEEDEWDYIRVSMEGPLEILIHAATRAMVGTPGYKTEDKSYSAGYKDVELNARRMPHLIYSDDEIYIEKPVNKNWARERINDRMTYSSQAYWDLPEKTPPAHLECPAG